MGHASRSVGRAQRCREARAFVEGRLVDVGARDGVDRAEISLFVTSAGGAVVRERGYEPSTGGAFVSEAKRRAEAIGHRAAFLEGLERDCAAGVSPTDDSPIVEVLESALEQARGRCAELGERRPPIQCRQTVFLATDGFDNVDPRVRDAIRRGRGLDALEPIVAPGPTIVVCGFADTADRPRPALRRRRDQVWARLLPEAVRKPSCATR